MTSKEILQHIKVAAWKADAEMDAFVEQARPTRNTDLDEYLELLLTRSLSQDADRHRMRCQVYAKMVASYGDRSNFASMARALKAADVQVRTLLVDLLPKVNHLPDHTILLGYLDAPEVELRKAAAQVLGQVAGSSTIQQLSEMLSRRTSISRKETIDALVTRARSQAIDPLRTAMPVLSTDEKLLAIKYLGDASFMGKASGSAGRVIAEQLSDANDRIVVQSIQALSNIASEQDYFEATETLLESKRLPIVTAVVQGLKRFNSPKVMATLSGKLHVGPNAVRFAVLATLETIGNEAAIPTLVSALGHRVLAVRTRAGEVIVRLANQRKVDLARMVVYLLRSPDVNVRRMAVEVAKAAGESVQEIWPRMLVALRDEDWWVRERVVDALVEMAGKQLTRHIVRFFKEESDVLRRYAVEVLRRLKDVEALGALVRVARDDADWWVREKAVEAIGELGDERAIPYLMEIIQTQPELHPVCIPALQALDARQALPLVTALLESPDTDVKLCALDFVECMNEPGCGGAVLPLLHDPDPQVVRRAYQALSRLKITVSFGNSAVGDVELRSPIDRYLVALEEAEGDDLILAAGRRVVIKKMGRISPISREELTAEQVSSALLPLLTGAQLEQLEGLQDIDFSYEIPSTGHRFRVNLFRQLSGFSAVFRSIKGTLPEFESLGLPTVVESFSDLKNGLVLVGGPTGSGKSTTLAALIDRINRKYARHIISIEDPIEVVHAQHKGLVNQREVGTHTRSFSGALRSTLREDPDVILVGELRDLATISFAVSAAETGHLVFGTVHTVSADSSIDRLVNAFPPGSQDQVRAMVAQSLRAVVCQYLIADREAKQRHLAVEIMINNEAIANLIRKGKSFQIPSVIATSKALGMQLMDRELMRLFRDGKISAEDAFVKAANKKEFEALLTGTSPEGSPQKVNLSAARGLVPERGGLHAAH